MITTSADFDRTYEGISNRVRAAHILMAESVFNGIGNLARVAGVDVIDFLLPTNDEFDPYDEDSDLTFGVVLDGEDSRDLPALSPADVLGDFLRDNRDLIHNALVGGKTTAVRREPTQDEAEDFGAVVAYTFTATPSAEDPDTRPEFSVTDLSEIEKAVSEMGWMTV